MANGFDGRGVGHTGDWQVRIDVVGNRFRFWAQCTGLSEATRSEGTLSLSGDVEARAGGVNVPFTRIIGKFPTLTPQQHTDCGGGDFFHT